MSGSMYINKEEFTFLDIHGTSNWRAGNGQCWADSKSISTENGYLRDKFKKEFKEKNNNNRIWGSWNLPNLSIQRKIVLSDSFIQVVVWLDIDM